MRKTRSAVLGAVVAALGAVTMGACSGGSTAGHTSTTPTTTRNAGVTAAQYATRVRSWAAAEAPLVKQAFDYPKNILLGRTDTKAGQKQEAADCDSAQTALQQLARFPEGDFPLSAKARPHLDRLRGMLNSLRAFCVPYGKSFAAFARYGQLNRKLQSYEYKGTTSYQGRTFTCHASSCLTPDTDRWPAYATLRARIYVTPYETQAANLAAAGNPFPAWKHLHAAVVASYQKTATAEKEYCRVVRLRNRDRLSAASRAAGGVERKAAAALESAAKQDYPSTVVKRYQRSDTSAYAYFGRLELERLAPSAAAETTALSAL